MILGLRTAAYHVDDIDKAREWYSTVLGFRPYFDEPFYVGFNVGGYELGLVPGKPVTLEPDSGVLVYWGVENAGAALKRLVELGAAKQNDLQDVGGGILVATVVDPFGNIFGIIENPHFSLESR
jgi:predicted enzyme related to lactoylglutathione lyase